MRPFGERMSPRTLGAVSPRDELSLPGVRQNFSRLLATLEVRSTDPSGRLNDAAALYYRSAIHVPAFVQVAVNTEVRPGSSQIRCSEYGYASFKCGICLILIRCSPAGTIPR